MTTSPSISDDYTGAISDQHIAQRRHVPNATIVKVSVGPMDNNAYFVRDTATGATVLIDAANDADRLLALARDIGGVDKIVTTHRHHDHWLALAALRDDLKVPAFAGEFDAEGIDVPTDEVLRDGATVRCGDLTLTVIHLAGHTPGSVALALTTADEVHLFTGDALFPGGVGRTQSPGEFTSLLNDVETKIFGRYADATVYPGHGADTTLAVERPHLAQWRARGW